MTSGSPLDPTKSVGTAAAANGDAARACIWLVQGHFNPVNLRGWLPFGTCDETERATEEELTTSKLNKNGHFLSADRFPTDHYPRRHDPAHRQRIPQLFSNGLYFIRKESADVLRQFDLGQGALYPTRLWHPDKKTPVPCEVFFLSQGNRKDAFLLDRSPGARPFSTTKWWPPSNPKHDQMVFSAAALEGPDIWWDEKIDAYYFVSDRLAKALKKAKLTRDWMLLRCPVMDARDGASASGGSAA